MPKKAEKVCFRHSLLFSVDDKLFFFRIGEKGYFFTYFRQATATHGIGVGLMRE